NFSFATRQVGGQPQPPAGEEFVSGIESLYVFFNWRQLSERTPWTWRWKVDGDTLIQVDTQWTAAPDGQFYYLSLLGEPNLPDATYTFEIEMGGILVASVDALVGLGRLPVDAFASAEGIQMNGRILDAETGQGISGAMFILLRPEFSVEDWLWDETQVLGTSLADQEGFFQLPVLLPRGTIEEPVLYSLLVRADGYLPMSADGIAVTDETESPMELTIELNRD
ncbi:MAG TPA: carboxypeptidase-like regulatory domain-containing protein, partial [Aggregatilineales bacterium]|nr:carboxypeptidase-like regulatory domain-containing protein [Aggregatilineales bacterium]